MAGRCLPAILFLVAAAAPPALAETYKWVDGKGVVNYSNAPPPATAAKPQTIDERISIVPTDPSLGPAIAAMRARAARREAYEEAEYARRQRYMQAAQASYSASYCAYDADCGVGYGTSAYYPYSYYPYAYGGRVFNAVAIRRHAPVVVHHASFHTGGRGTVRGGRGSFR